MTAPFQYRDRNAELGFESPVFQSEWEAMLDRRRQLVEEISERLKLTQQLGPTAADTAAVAHQMGGTNADGTPTQYQQINTPPTQNELNQLLGAAEFYGISNADKIPPHRLKFIVEQRRLATQQETAAQREGAGLARKAGETVAEGIAAMGLGVTQDLLAVAQRLPFVGDAISRMKSVQEADQYFAQAAEGVIAGMDPEEASGFRTASKIGGMVGYAVPATASWKVAGAAGRIGFVAKAGQNMTPLARAAVQGGAASWIEWGGDKSNEEILLTIGLGAAAGAGFTYLEGAVPRFFERVRSAFRGKTDPFYGEGGFGPQGRETVDAEWYFEAEQPQLRNPREPLYDTPYYGPGQERVGPAGLLPREAGPVEVPSAGPPPTGGAPQQQQVYGFLGEPQRPAGLLMSPEKAAMQERINTLVEQRDVARRLTETDPLTGGGNRAALMRAQESVDADPELSWVVFDGKQFKAVNDNFGHQTGDQVLGNFGRAIQQAAGELQVPARFFRQGGDEFAAIVPKAQAADFARRATELSFQRLKTQAGTTVETKLDSYAADTFSDADLQLMQNKRNPVSATVPRHPNDSREIARQALEWDVAPDRPLDQSWYSPEEWAGIQEGRLVPTQGGLKSPEEIDTIQRKIKELTPTSILTREAAAVEGAQLSKQAVLMEVGDHPTLLGAEITHADVARAALTKNPGAINVIRGVGDASKTVRQLVQAQSEGRLMPHTFRFVQRGESLDLLVSDGLPITNKRAKQYTDHGLFDGQRAVAQGREVIIRSPGEVFTEVELPYGGTKLRMATQSVLPMGSTDPVSGLSELYPEAPKLYENFQAYVMTQMERGGAALGVPKPFDWLGHETSTQLPRMLDDFLTAKKITAPAARAAVEAYFNVRRVDDFRRLAPQEAKELDAVVNELNAAVEAKPPVDLPIEDIAATKGFSYVNSTEDYGGTLVDRLSDLRVPVDSPESALEFLRAFQRDVPDYTPLDEVPFELANAGPNAASAGDDLAPRFEGGAEQYVESVNRNTRRIEQDFAPAREPVPPSGGGSPPPSPPAPPAQGGAPQPPSLPPSQRSSVGAGFERVRAQRPTELDRALEELDSAWLNYMDPFRTATLKIQDILQNVGVDEAELWKHSNDLRVAVSTKHNAEHPWMREATDIFGNFGRRKLRTGVVSRINRIADRNQRLDAMQKAGYTQREVQAQLRLEDFYSRFFSAAANMPVTDPNVGRRVFKYISEVGTRQSVPGFKDPYADTNNSLPPEFNFLVDALRGADYPLRGLDARIEAVQIVRATMFQKHVAPSYNLMREAWNDKRVPKELRDIVNEWLYVLKHGHNPGYDVAIQGIRHVLNKFGVPVTDGEVAANWNILFSNIYRGQIGGRPDVIFRDAISPFISGTRIGFTPVVQAYTNFLKGGAARQAMVDRAYKGGWVEEGMVRSPIAEVFEGQIQTEYGLTPLPQSMQNRREYLARIGDAVWAMTPRRLRGGIQGTAFDPMLAYTKLGEINRIIAGEAGWLKADAAITKYKTRLQEIVDTANYADSDAAAAELMDASGADVYPLPIQKEFRRLAIEAGDWEGAANLLARESANSQFLYGSKETSIGIRKAGVTGRAAMTFGSFSQQYIALMRESFGPHIPPQKRVSTALRHGTVMGILGLAGAYTGWKFSKWMWHQSLTFAGGPLATAAYERLLRTTGNIAEMVGATPSPLQSAAVARGERTGIGEDLLSAAATVFPYSSTARTADRLTTAATGLNPIEATARVAVTGDRGLGSDFRQFFNQAPVTTPDDVEAAVMGNADARAKFSTDEIAFLESVRHLPREQRFQAYTGWRSSRARSIGLDVADPRNLDGYGGGQGARY